MECANFFEIKEGCKFFLFKNISLVDLLGSQYLFEISQTLLTVAKVKKWMLRKVSKRFCDGVHKLFLK